MIRLTLHPHFDPEIYLFNKSTIFLGSDSSKVDLSLDGDKISPIHLKILKQNDQFILVNYANDPFVLVNDLPFGKKILQSGDIFTIQEIPILFEIIKPLSPLSCSSNDLNLGLCEENHLGSQPLEENKSLTHSFPLPFLEEEISALQADEWPEEAVNAYLKEVESGQKKEDRVFSPAKTEEKKGNSLKDDYLKELEDENHKHQKSPFIYESDSSHLYQAWKSILIFIATLFTLSAIAGGLIYLNAHDKREVQETKAAQGVADLAMALTRARLAHLKPYNQNWSDVDFLKNNLQILLPDAASYASQIDSQGQFNCCPYKLRIYTNRDLSHFLLIAQPIPTLFYWLIPRSILVVDSHLMELRTLQDVRGLNRLVANADPLEGFNGKEITQLIRQGGLIQLAGLAADSGNLDFAPPKNLGWICPGAENLIYNCPRYHRLGQILTQKALHLSTSKGSSQLVVAFKQDVSAFDELPHFVLYSDQGKKTALVIRQGLKTFAPSDKLLFGYLLFNAQGQIHQAHLLKEEETLKERPVIAASEEPVAFEAPPFPQPLEIKEEKEEKKEDFSTAKQNHPIYVQLRALLAEREHDLKDWSASLTHLMTQDLQTPHPEFQEEFQKMSHRYLAIHAKHQQNLKEMLKKLYHQYHDLPIDQFLSFVKELNLHPFMEQKEKTLALIDEQIEKKMSNLIAHFQKSHSLAELDRLACIACEELTLDLIKNPEELKKHENVVRNQLLKELERLVLSSETKISKEKRKDLEKILNQERFIRQEEKEFFLKVFDEAVFKSQQEDVEDK